MLGQNMRRISATMLKNRFLLLFSIRKTYRLESMKVRIPKNLLENLVLKNNGPFYTQNMVK